MSLPTSIRIEPDGLSGANVWVEKSDVEAGRIAAEYKEMKGLSLCEEKFARVAKETFLQRAWRSVDTSEDRRWRAERMLQLVCPPQENAHWCIPPLLDSNASSVAEWSWDIRPDCAYWLSLKGFNQQYSFHVQNCAFVQDYITCPYFTIEFKRDGQSHDVAVKQVAAAGAMALYNRWRLFSEAKYISLSFIGTIRHYALTFIGPKFVFWILQPTPRDGQWSGCTMRRLVGSECTAVYGVRELIDWINEVHR